MKKIQQAKRVETAKEIDIKRFRVFDREKQTRPFAAHTTKEIYEWLTKRGNVDDLFIDCIVDDIEVDAQEFIDLYKEEAPGDLQMF